MRRVLHPRGPRGGWPPHRYVLWFSLGLLIAASSVPLHYFNLFWFLLWASACFGAVQVPCYPGPHPPPVRHFSRLHRSRGALHFLTHLSQAWAQSNQSPAYNGTSEFFLFLYYLFFDFSKIYTVKNILEIWPHVASSTELVVRAYRWMNRR